MTFGEIEYCVESDSYIVGQATVKSMRIYIDI